MTISPENNEFLQQLEKYSCLNQSVLIDIAIEQLRKNHFKDGVLSIVLQND